MWISIGCEYIEEYVSVAIDCIGLGAVKYLV